MNHEEKDKKVNPPTPTAIFDQPIPRNHAKLTGEHFLPKATPRINRGANGGTNR